MMRRGGMNGTIALETISAAAAAVASVENRVPQASVQKRRWASCWSLYWCFGSYKNNKRIGHAALFPETSASGTDVPTAEHPSRLPSVILPFVAPPSSPASFLPSEPHSSAQSPTSMFSVTSLSANMYSPGGPSSIFTIGPYAHEIELVSPPVFSTFVTEPSTAPYTPSELVDLTTPSSPEVPFAKLLDPNRQNGEECQRFVFSQYELQSYQLQPGSPVSHLISPRSGISCSGVSSPFHEHEFASGFPCFLELRTGDPPKLLVIDDKTLVREWKSHEVSGEVTPDTTEPRSCNGSLFKRQYLGFAPLTDMSNGLRDDATAEELRDAEKKRMTLPANMPESVENIKHIAEENPIRTANLTDETSKNSSEKALMDGNNRQKHKRNRTITLGSTKEFNFECMNGQNSDEHNGGHDWWANEKAVDEDREPTKNWSFFPILQTGAS